MLALTLYVQTDATGVAIPADGEVYCVDDIMAGCLVLS